MGSKSSRPSPSPSPSPPHHHHHDVTVKWNGPLEIERGNMTDAQWQELQTDSPTQQLKIAIERFGQPSALGVEPGAGALWTYSNLLKHGHPYYRVLIEDFIVPHTSPVLHGDFMTYGIPFLVQTEEQERRLSDLLMFSKSIWYDRLLQVLYVRCHFHPANVATLALAIYVMTRDDFYGEYYSENGIFENSESGKEFRAKTYGDFIMAGVPPMIRGKITASMSPEQVAEKTSRAMAQVKRYDSTIDEYVMSIDDEWAAVTSTPRE